MLYPRFLEDNGTIAFVAPSFGCATEPYKTCFDSALEKFRDMGYKTVLGPNCYKGDGIGISTNPKACADELEDYYTNNDNDVIIACGGGELMCETISELDLVRIRQSTPKWVLGYSDISNIIFLLTTMCDVASIYGYCAGTFGMSKWHKSVKDTFDILRGINPSGEDAEYKDNSKKVLTVCNYPKFQVESLKDSDNPLASFNCTEEVYVKAYDGIMSTENISFEGRLVGGCLDVLSGLIGTRFDYVNQFSDKYEEDGIIWFLEACELNVFSIRRSLWSMKEAGWFRNVKGFIFGRPMMGEEMMNLDHITAELSVISEALSVPVILDADIGHVPPMMPIISGSYASVNYQNGQLTISMELI